MVDTVVTGLGEARMLVGGELVGAASGATFDNVNPATEQVIGVTADASVEDMERAVAAARAAFDGSSWSRDAGFRRRCLQQLQAGLESAKEELRRALVAEAGCPVALTRYRQSGVGRENGVEGFEEYLEVKTVGLPARG